MLKRLGGAALLGALAYTTADAAADSVLYVVAKRMVLQQAEGNERFCRELGGPPLRAGPWYNSSVAVTHDGHVATVTLPVAGSKRSSDVTLRAVRKGGLRSTLLYNLVGGAEWEPLVMSALVGMGAGGAPVSMSLLQQREPEVGSAAAEATGLAAHAHAHMQRRRHEAGQAQAGGG